MKVENSIVYTQLNGAPSSFTLRHNEPEECPICKKGIKPNFLYGFGNKESNSFFIMYECGSCHKAFIKSGQMAIDAQTGKYDSVLISEELAPNLVVKIDFSKYIQMVSPSFINVYNQAHAAETYGLSEISGIGYRKSIEFLIKDYLSLPCNTDEEKEAIKSKPLAQCISKDISNENLKITASRAVWIGNDETHYIRKHTDKDITDLKRLIDLTVRWIEMECMTKEAEGIPYIK